MTYAQLSNDNRHACMPEAGVQYGELFLTLIALQAIPFTPSGQPQNAHISCAFNH